MLRADQSATTSRPVRFGISVAPLAEAYRDIVSQVRAAERGGLDLVGIQDHPYQRRFLDTFALIADLLARTSRLRFFPDVANLPRFVKVGAHPGDELLPFGDSLLAAPVTAVAG